MDLGTKVQMVDAPVFAQLYSLALGKSITSFVPHHQTPSHGLIVGQIGLFSFGQATDLGEGKFKPGIILKNIDFESYPLRVEWVG